MLYPRDGLGNQTINVGGNFSCFHAFYRQQLLQVRACLYEP